MEDPGASEFSSHWILRNSTAVLSAWCTCVRNRRSASYSAAGTVTGAKEKTLSTWYPVGDAVMKRA